MVTSTPKSVIATIFLLFLLGCSSILTPSPANIELVDDHPKPLTPQQAAVFNEFQQIIHDSIAKYPSLTPNERLLMQKWAKDIWIDDTENSLVWAIEHTRAENFIPMIIGRHYQMLKEAESLTKNSPACTEGEKR